MTVGFCFAAGRCGGNSADSCSSAAVDVVRKHPRIAFIAILCAVSSLESSGGRRVEPYFVGLCQIDAARSILGATTAVNSFLTLSMQLGPHVVFAILDIARENLVPFLATFWMWWW